MPVRVRLPVQEIKPVSKEVETGFLIYKMLKNQGTSFCIFTGPIWNVPYSKGLPVKKAFE